MGSSLPIMFTKRAGQIRCNRWSDRMQTPGQAQCKRVVSTDAIRWSSGVQFRSLTLGGGAFLFEAESECRFGAIWIGATVTGNKICQW